MCGGMWTHTYLFLRNEKIHHFPAPRQNWRFFLKILLLLLCVCASAVKFGSICSELRATLCSSSSPHLATKRKTFWALVSELNCEFNFQLTSHRFLCVSPFPSFRLRPVFRRTCWTGGLFLLLLCVCRLRFFYFSILGLLFLGALWCGVARQRRRKTAKFLNWKLEKKTRRRREGKILMAHLKQESG